MNRFQFPRWNELPSLDLYMDQVITYLQSNLESTYFSDEKFITKAMINNYVKTSIVAPPIKKHYTKQHIAYFMVVTIVKRCYSMSQISQLIEIHTHMKYSSVEQAYDLFISFPPIKNRNSWNMSFNVSYIKYIQNMSYHKNKDSYYG